MQGTCMNTPLGIHFPGDVRDKSSCFCETCSHLIYKHCVFLFSDPSGRSALGMLMSVWELISELLTSSGLLQEREKVMPSLLTVFFKPYCQYLLHSLPFP